MKTKRKDSDATPSQVKGTPERREPPPRQRRHVQDMHDRFDALAMQVRQLLLTESGKQSRVVGVTSCERGEGVSTVAANLAVSAAAIMGDRVLLVDGCTQHPAVASQFRVASAPGLTEALTGKIGLESCCHTTGVANLSVMPIGGAAAQNEVISDAMTLAEMLRELSGSYTFIVVDMPPALESGNCCLWAGAVDGLLMVLEAGRVPAEVAQRTKLRMLNLGVKVLGAVLTKE
ncbi:MAG: CpsD/CapB family tyrosine-protein kinase [Pirellulaceae bacterium]|nr:CpsD/CapB family tyrosine-protein kinase [Planctomycetales bacterium]